MTEVHWNDGVLLRPRGDLIEGPACDGLERTLGRLLERGQSVIVCLGETGQLAAHALGVLAHARAVADERGGRITLCCARPHHKWLLERTGLTPALGVHDSEAEARASLAREIPGAA
jgi:anti-anti-sigma regulatory factor